MKRIHKRIGQFLDDASKKSGLPKWWLYLDCIFNCLFRKCSIRDYFIFKYYHLNRFGKKEYLSGIEQDDWYTKHNDNNMESILNDKEACLRHFSSIINRDWCGVKYNNTKEDYINFEKKHSRAIFKPLNLCGGKGISIMDFAEIQGGIHQFATSNSLLVEELIEQDRALNQLYPYSVNSVRMVTKNGILIAAVLRVGRNKSSVDNLSAGGIAAAIDIKTGIVCSIGKTYLDEAFVMHPDTGVTIPGFRIPQWEKCKEYVAEAVKLCSGIPVIGWDIAITLDGPTIIEVNARPEIEAMELPLEKGLRRVMREKFI